MTQLLNYFGVGGLGLLLLSVFFEITPIPINPIQWLGKQLTSDIKKDLKKINVKLDDHIVSSYRNNILSFQEKLLFNSDEKYTRERWKKVLNDCRDYEAYIKANDLTNGEIEEATAFIRFSYQNALRTLAFKDIPQISNTEQEEQ